MLGAAPPSRLHPQGPVTTPAHWCDAPSCHPDDISKSGLKVDGAGEGSFPAPSDASPSAYFRGDFSLRSLILTMSQFLVASSQRPNDGTKADLFVCFLPPCGNWGGHGSQNLSSGEPVSVALAQKLCLGVCPNEWKCVWRQVRAPQCGHRVFIGALFTGGNMQVPKAPVPGEQTNYGLYL